MSFPKMDRTFPLNSQAISDTELSQIVASALHQDFGKTASVIKQIGRLTGTNPRTVKNWYEAKNAPSAGRLLLLARTSPTLLKFILEQIGGGDLTDAFNLLEGHMAGVQKEKKLPRKMEIYSAVNCTINPTRSNGTGKKFNQRQIWFIEKMKRGENLRAEDIVYAWQVSLRTAKYDIAELMAAEIIEFRGAKKTGWYELNNATEL